MNGAMQAVTAFVITLLSCTVANAQERNPLEKLTPLVGTWQGESSGFGLTSDASAVWEFKFNGTYLQSQTRTVPQGESQADPHRDLGVMSYDKDNRTLVFRDFLSEGFVNTFHVTLMEAEFLKLKFNHHESESSGGMRVQMMLEFKSPDEYEIVLDLAPPNGDFKPCQTIKMKRVK